MKEHYTIVPIQWLVSHLHLFIRDRIQKLLYNTGLSVCCIVSDFESSTDPATNLIVAGSVGCSLGKGGIFVWHGCRPPRGPLSRRDGSREKKGAVATWATRHLRCASKYPVCSSARGQPLSRVSESHYRDCQQRQLLVAAAALGVHNVPGGGGPAWQRRRLITVVSGGGT